MASPVVIPAQIQPGTDILSDQYNGIIKALGLLNPVFSEAYIPIVVPLAPMTLSATTTNTSAWARVGSMVFYTVSFSGTLGGVASNRIDISLPVQFGGNRTWYGSGMITQATGSPALIAVSFSLPAVAQVLYHGATNYTLGTVSFGFTVAYRIL